MEGDMYMNAALRWSIPGLVRVVSASILVALATGGLASVAAGQGAQPALAVSVPSDSGVVAGTNVTVRFSATGIRLVPTTVPIAQAGQRPDANRPGEGHVHFMLDAQPLVVWERAEPYTFANVPPGDHVLMVELVQNDHGPLSPPIARQIRFRTTALLGASGAAPARPAVQGALLAGLTLGALGFAGPLLWRRLAVAPTRRPR
jgi:hypothetical protein